MKTNVFDNDSKKFKNISMGYFFILILSIIIKSDSQEVKLKSNIVGELSVYQFQYGDFSISMIEKDSYLEIIFPSEYSITKLYDQSPYSVQNSSSNSCPVIMNCSGTTIQYKALKIIIKGLYSSNALYFGIISVSNIPNPMQAKATGQFQLNIIQPSGTIVSSIASGVTITSQSMTCIAVPIKSILWSSTTLQFTLNPTLLFNSLKLQFDNPWQNEVAVLNSLNTDLTCSSNTHPTLKCVKQNSGSHIIILITQINYISIIAINIRINTINIPSVIMDVGSITINTYSSLNNELNQCIISINSSYLQSQSLRNVLTSVKYQNQNQIQIILSFSFPKISLPNDKVFIVFPSQLKVPSLQSNYKIAITGQTSSIVSINSTNNTIQFQPFSLQARGAQLSLTISAIPRPRQQIITSEFELFTKRSNNIMDYSTCCNISLQPRKTLLVNNITLSKTRRLATNVDYIFSLTNSNISLIVSDQITIQFPLEYSAQLTASSTATICSAISLVISSQNTNSVMACIVSDSVINITSFLTQNLSVNAVITITIKGVLNNPISTPVHPFIISTRDNLGYILQYNNQKNIVITASYLPSYSINPLSLICSTITTYTINFQNIGGINAGYSISIIFPIDITEILANLMKCFLNSNQVSCFISQINPFIVNLTSDITITNINTIITISNVLNPLTTKPTGIFQIYISDQKGFLTQQSSPNITQSITMSLPNKFSDVIIGLDQQIQLGGDISLNFILICPYSPVLNTSTIIIQLGVNIQTGPSTSCSHLFLDATCTRTLNIIQLANIQLLSLKSSIFTFNLTNIRFISDSNPIKSISLIHNNFQSIKSQNINLPNSYAILLDNYSLIQSNYIMGQQSNLTIETVLPIGIPINYAIAFIPSQYTPNDAINITIAPFNSIAISNITNPLTKTSSAIIIKFYSSNHELLAITNPVSTTENMFTLKCSLPCKTCSLTNISFCTSCYNFVSIPQKYLFSTEGRCVDHCEPGTYFSGVQCLPCNSSCFTCDTNGNGSIGNPNLCIQCRQNAYLLSQFCYDDCPVGYYPNHPICSLCTTNCVQCYSLTNCSVCLSTFKLYDAKCMQNCPQKTIQNNSQCLSCPMNCLQCASNLSCLVCQIPFIIHNSQCVTICPVSPIVLYISYNFSCQLCQCSQCSLASYNCTKCIANEYLYKYKCYSVCPDSLYPSSITCQLCPSSCLTCKSLTLCISCRQNYALYTFQLTTSCVSSCPNTTILSINSSSHYIQCLSCTNNCLTCYQSVSYCLSCQQNYNFHNNSCVNVCPNLFHSINKNCKKCTSQCLSCTIDNPYNCTECVANFYLHQQSCLSTCPSGTYHFRSSKKCLACQPLCQTCINSTNCTACKSGYYIFKWACYLTCPTTPIFYYSYNFLCLVCQPQCVSCLNNPFQCSQCSNISLYKFNPQTKQCTISCTDPFFLNNSQCIRCLGPCKTCDTTFNSCLTCQNEPTLTYLLHGSCLTQCPQGYASKISTLQCQKCYYLCSTCDQSRCLTCQPYSFTYHLTCVLDCSIYEDLPFHGDSYCTACQTVPLCTICSSSNVEECSQCAYPYIMFNGVCLNNCPQNYTSNSNRQCVINQAYQTYLLALYAFNKPILLPFTFLFCVLLVCLITSLISQCIFYPYTYYSGAWIAILSIGQTLYTWYSLYYLVTRYEGNYKHQDVYIPIILLCIGWIFSVWICGLWFSIDVLSKIYLKDIRYRQWAKIHKQSWISIIILLCFTGPRSHKLFYSKIFGKDQFSFRIISVSKFKLQDIINIVMCFGDILIIISLIIVAYNVFISYSVLFFLGFQMLLFKSISWILLIYDSFKPDRGFFKGDQQYAQVMQLQQKQDFQQNLRRVDTIGLVKMIRKKSSPELNINKQWQIDPIEYLSVYNPEDYQEMPVIHWKKIQTNLYRGTFRKGNKITIQQKLNRFADTIQPLPKIIQNQKQKGYMNKLIYWQPPKKIKITAKKTFQQPSCQNLLQILYNKQQQYKQDLQEIQLQTIYNDNQNKKQQSFEINKNNFNKIYKKSFNEIDQTILNQTYDFIYPSDEICNDIPSYNNNLMNLNYAKKKHLPRKQRILNYDSNQMRILYHKPQKKRKSPL